MRKAVLLLTMIGLGLALTSGVALAANSFTGTDKADRLEGSNGVDRLAGGGGNDLIRGLDGDDDLFGDHNGDELRGGPGADFLNAADDISGNDVVDCGGSASGDGAQDTVIIDSGDTLKNCDLTEGDEINTV